MTTKREEKRQRWQQHIQQWKLSGLSQRTYCEEHGLTLNQFWYWQRQFGSAKSSSSNASTHPAQNEHAAFVPVQVTAPETSNTGLCLELPNGIRLHGIASSSPATIKHIIQAVSCVV